MSKNLTVPEVADLLSITRRYLMTLLDEGKFPNAFKVGDSLNSPWRIPESDIQNYIEQQRQKSQPT